MAEVVRITRGKDECSVCSFIGSSDNPLVKLTSVHLGTHEMKEYLAHRVCVGTLLVVRPKEMFQAVLTTTKQVR
jgi:hypothetical protein